MEAVRLKAEAGSMSMCRKAQEKRDASEKDPEARVADRKLSWAVVAFEV